MKRVIKLGWMLLMMVVVTIFTIISIQQVFAASTPYYTYTTDNEEGWIMTSDAYTPDGQITSSDEVRFVTPEYVYVDHEDYVYVTDSGAAKVFIFDQDLNYIDEISYTGNSEQTGFFAVNSIFVTEDKIYIPDSFAKAIFVFDRDEVLSRPQAFVMWMSDTDGDQELSDGDKIFLADEEGHPTGSLVYNVQLGDVIDGRQSYDFFDIETDELLFNKIDILEMTGKFLGNWVTTELEGETLYKISVSAGKNEPIQIVGTPEGPVFSPKVVPTYDDYTTYCQENPETDECAELVYTTDLWDEVKYDFCDDYPDCDLCESDVRGYTYAPRKVVVDTRGNMYIVGAQSDNGLIMLNYDGEFVTFFGGNPIRTPLVDQIRSLLLSDEQEEKLREASNIFIDYISGVAIDEKGFIYTVTSTLEDNNIKKFNVSGTNYFDGKSYGWIGAVDIEVGQYGNIIVVEENGWINEYSSEGDLIFSFSVQETVNEREGLLKLPKAISIDSNDRLFVVDQGNDLVQVYAPTAFADSIHQALEAYQDGDEAAAEVNWKYALEYATIFDLAHTGLGDSYVRQDMYEEALIEYTLASDRDGISQTFWQVRQFWLEANLETVFLVIIGLIVMYYTSKYINKKTHYTEKLKSWIKTIRERSSLIDELAYIFTFIRHPLNGYYEIKRLNRVSAKTATVIYLLLAIVYVFYQEVTNIVFLDSFDSNNLYNLIILIIIFSLWVIANYFVCLISDGEGSFKNVYVSTAMSFTPLLFIIPVMALFSNVLTLQESVFFTGPITFAFIWVAIYFFFMIKEVHNYEVSETVGIIFKSAFTMLIMGIFIFVIYSLNSQIFRVSEQIIRELVER
jgi:tetratricopeptide (TPR) repeat protein